MNAARRHRRADVRSAKRQATERLITTLAAGCDCPAKLLELYYWSKEPGLLEVIRGIAAMREDVRAAIEAFIALAGDAQSTSADLDGRGVLTLASAQAARTAALARYLAANDADELSRMPH
jgi:hypothetical protein